MNFKIKNMIMCSLFVALIIIGAFIKIQISIIPITLQSLFTMMAGILLGAKLGFVAVAVYIVLGLAGLPVFAQGGGIGYVLQPGFGYIIGFAVGAFVTGAIANKCKNAGIKRLLFANFVGLAVIYVFGMVYYYLISDLYLSKPIGIGTLFLYCFVPFIPGDSVLCVLGAFLGKRLIPIMSATMCKN